MSYRKCLLVGLAGLIIGISMLALLRSAGRLETQTEGQLPSVSRRQPPENPLSVSDLLAHPPVGGPLVIRGEQRSTGEGLPMTRPRESALTGSPARMDDQEMRPIGRRPPRALRIHVTNRQTGHPLANVRVTLHAGHPFTLPVSATRTDPQGYCSLGRTSDKGLSTLRAEKPGFVPAISEIAPGAPSRLDLILDTADGQVGGRVVTSLGDPLEGATLELVLRGKSLGSHFQLNYMTRTITTDSAGRWQCIDAPADISWLDLMVHHSEYSPKSLVINEPDLMRNPGLLSPFLDRTHLITVYRDRSLSGKVTAAGGAISGASLSAQSQIWQTDEQGYFEIVAGDPNQMWTIAAEGFNAKQQRLGLRWNPIRLEESSFFVGSVVDIWDQPIRAVLVDIALAKGTPALWQVETDAGGQFVCEAGTKYITFAKPGYRRARLTTTDSLNQKTVTLYPILRISGRVFDAETGEPIKRFTVAAGTVSSSFSDREVTWQTPTRETGGRYSRTVEEDADGFTLLAQAPGFIPMQSRTIRANEMEVVIDFDLDRGSGPRGHVLDEYDRPVVGAMVYAVQDALTLVNGQVTQEARPLAQAQTDSRGHFQFDALHTAPNGFVGLAGAGIGSISAADLVHGEALRLKGWGAIEGHLYLDGRAMAHTSLYLGGGSDANGLPYIEDAYRIQTEPDGTFRVDRVAPGPVMLGDSELYHVEANETLELPLRRNGKTVQGTVFGSWDFDQIQSDLHIIQVLADGNPVIGASQWVTEVSLDSRGSFEVDGLGAGTYALTGRLFEVTGAGIHVAARVFQPFFVSQVSHLEDYLKTGNLNLIRTLPDHLYAFDMAPGFRIPSLAGSFVELYDYEGKIVLLSFYGAEEVTSPNLEFERLKESYARFSNDPRFAMLGIFVDATESKARDRVKAAKLPWEHGLAGSLYSEICLTYDLTRPMPWNVLVDRHQQVYDIGLRGPELSEAIEMALEEF